MAESSIGMRTFAFACAINIVAACDHGPTSRLPEGVVTRRDSAGVVIIESGTPGEGTEPRWWVDTVPVIEIGVVSGESPYQFERITEARSFPDGSMAVVDAGVFEIRVFSRDGQIQAVFGGRGEGPGEFGSAPRIAIQLPDTIVAWDRGLRRITKFHRDGTVLSSHRPLDGLEAYLTVTHADPWLVASDGSIVVHRTEEEPIELMDRNAMRLWKSVTLVSGRGLEAVGVGRWSMGERYYARGAQVDNPFAPRVPVVLGPKGLGVFVVPSGDPEIVKFDQTGAIESVIRATVPRIPVSNELVRAARDSAGVLPEAYVRMLESVGFSPADVQEGFDRHNIPDTLPAIDELRIDTEGRLWARRFEALGYRGPHVHDIFDTSGIWLGTLSASRRLGNITEVAPAHVLAEWRDGMGVPFLRMYRVYANGG